MKLMIVEDSDELRRIIASFIGDVVEEFVECRNGDEALATYSANSPDLVLMDLRMRQVDGFETTRQLKTAFPEAMVIMVSQWDSPVLRQAAELAGAEAYVNKEDLRRLSDIIQNVGLTL
jgi:two-component system chemotaxis response regulator CheY